MKVEQLNRLEELGLAQIDFVRKVSYRQEQVIDYFISLTTEFPTKDEKEAAEAFDALGIIYNRFGKLACRSIIDIICKYLPHKKYSLNQIVWNFLSPIIDNSLDIWQRKKAFCQLCTIPGFLDNILTERVTIDGVKDAYFQRIVSLLDSRNELRRLLFDQNLIKEGTYIHYEAITWYNSLSATIYNNNLPDKRNLFCLVGKMVHDIYLIKYFYAFKGDNPLILHFEKAFLDDWCYDEIISNPAILNRRNPEEICKLAHYYSQYKDEDIENIKPLLNDQVLLSLPFDYQMRLINVHKDKSKEAFNRFVQMIRFILVEFAPLGEEVLKSILYYCIINPIEELDINALLVRGWPLESLKRFLIKYQIESFTGATTIKQYILRDDNK